MKFQTNRIAKFALIAALALSAVGVVGAHSNNNNYLMPDPCPSSQPVVPMGPPPCPTPEPVIEETPAPAPVDYEENVSFNDTDLGVALFKATDKDGNPSMDFFKVETGTTTSTYLFSVTQADIAPYIANPPAVNTKLASADGVAVYILTTGEIQVNAGPDAEGKIHVKIFNGIPWTQVYGYTIDPVK